VIGYWHTRGVHSGEENDTILKVCIEYPSLNRVVIKFMLKIFAAGQLGKDAVLRAQETSGAPIASFSLGVKHRGNTEWLSCSLMGKRAEDLAPHLKKGIGVAIEGDVYADAWVDKSTKEIRSVLRVWVNELSFVGPKKDKKEQPATEEAHNEEPEPVA
jgi:single-strand DNA-binding protein